VLQCVAVCCSVLQCVAVCCRCCSMLQCVASCCSVLQLSELQLLQYVALCCIMLQCVAVWCNVLQCVASAFQGANLLMWLNPSRVTFECELHDSKYSKCASIHKPIRDSLLIRERYSWRTRMKFLQSSGWPRTQNWMTCWVRGKVRDS